MKTSASASHSSKLLIFPAVGWLLWFLIVPLAIIAVYSVMTKGIYGGVVFKFSLEHYTRAVDLLYLRIVWNSIKLAALTTVSCFLLGYPMAYVMATASRRLRPMLLLFVFLPFWTNLVLRAYAIKYLLGQNGPINSLSLALGLLAQPIDWSNKSISVWLGMVTNYLPFMVIPLYVALEKLDFTLIEAAKDLGASSWTAIRKVVLPLSKHGIITGAILVFTPALGEFVIPDLLGGARTMMIGNLITEQFLKARNWPFGAALSVLLMAPVFLSLFLTPAEEEEKRGRRT